MPSFEKLDSGMQLVVVEDHTLPLVSVQLWYRVGSADDPPGTPGVSHVVRTILEHRDQAAVRLRAAGLELVSRTLRDACTFETVLPPSHLDFVLGIEAARMRPLSIDAETLRAALREPDAIADMTYTAEEWMLDALLAEHPYGFQPWFVATTVEKLPPEALERFARRWFSAGNAALFVIGDVSPAEVSRRVHEKFAGLPASERPRRPDRDLPPPEHVGSDVPGQFPLAIVGWLTPPLGAVENAAIDVLSQQLVNPLDGLLRARWSGSGGEFGVLRGGWRECGCLLVRAPPLSLVREKTADHRRGYEAAWDAVRSELETAATFVPTEAAHDRNRALARAAAAREYGEFDRRCSRLAELEIVAGDILLAEHELTAYDRVSVLDVQNAAKTLLERRSAAVHTRRPGEPAPNAPSAAPASPDEPPVAPLLSPSEPATHSRHPSLSECVGMLRAVPLPGSHWQPPRLESVRVAGGPTLQVLCVRSLPTATVVTVPRARPAFSKPGCGSTRLHVPGFDEKQSAEYLAFRSVRVTFASGEDLGGPAIASDSPVDSLDAMLEIHARLIRATCALGQSLPEHLEVFVVSAADAAAVAQLFAASWGPSEAFAPSAGATTGGPDAIAARSGASPEAGSDTFGAAGEGSVEIRWQPSDADASMHLELRFAQAACLEAHAVLATRALSIALGDPHFGVGMYPDGRLFIQFEELTPADLTARIDELRSALRSLRDGSLPPAQADAALRVARTRRFVALTGSSAIADALVRGESNPWDLHDELSPQAWAAWARRALAAATLRLEVIGGGESARAATERLRTELGGRSGP